MIVPEEPEASIIKFSFEKIATSQFSTEQIWKTEKENGLKCGKNNFLLAMRNPVYCGKITVPKYKDEELHIVQGLHEPLVSEHLFYEVQDVMDGRKRQQGTKFASVDQLPLRGFYCVQDVVECLQVALQKVVKHITTTIIVHLNAVVDIKQKR